MSHGKNTRLVVTCSLALFAGACGNDAPTSPTAIATTTTPEPVTLTGNWSTAFQGELFSGEGRAQLTHTGTSVTGEWSLPMPAPLVGLGAPRDIDLAGPVNGSAAPTTAEFSFSFLEALAAYFGGTDCALNVAVASLDEMRMEATWATDDACQQPVNDEGTLTLVRQ